jgi:type II secretory pathway pseudopilin PulG
MNTHPKKCKQRPPGQARGWSLIEIVGVLTVIAILAAVLLPSLIRQLDKAAIDQEVSTLKSFADALQQGIQSSRYIPGTNDWATSIAANLGVSSSAVLQNPRQQNRAFLIDPSGLFGTLPLPYAQTNTGTVSPVNARLIIVSSLGTTLPVATGTPNATVFSNLWNWVDATPLTFAPFDTWAGSPSDLIVQRINLSPLFFHLILTTYGSTQTALYGIDSSSQFRITTLSWLDAFFLQGSIVGLYYDAGAGTNLDSRQILNADSSFVYFQNVWRANISGSQANQVGVFDFAAVVSAFLAAPTNSVAGAASQSQVVQSMIDFMNAYYAWASAGFPGTKQKPDATYYTPAKNAQQAMMNAAKQLYANPIPTPYN